jgi:FSR family fosmidomycin resistance protein-like MFS transporter
MVSQTVNKSSTYAIILILALAHFLIDFMIGIWPVYKSIAQLDLAKAGMVVALGAFIGEGSQLIFGSLSDRGYTRALIFFGILAASSSIFLSYFNQYSFLFVIYLTTCLGSGAFHPTAAGLASGLISSRRGLVMTIFAFGGSLGMAISQVVFAHVYQVFNGHTVLLAIPTLVLACILCFFKLPQTTSPHFDTEKKKNSIKDIFKFFKRPELRFLYLSQLSNQTLMWGTIFILPDALRVLGHKDWICFGGGHLCLILGSSVTLIPAGYLADKYSTRSVMLYAGLIASVAFYLMIFLGSISAMLALSALFLLGASIGILNPLAVALGNRLVPDQPGMISAFLMGFVWCTSEALGPGGVGLLSNMLGEGGPIKALAILGGFFLLNIYSTLQLPVENEVQAKTIPLEPI